MEKTINQTLLRSVLDTFNFVLQHPLPFVFSVVTTALFSILQVSAIAGFIITMIVALWYFNGKDYVKPRLHSKDLKKTLLKSQFLTFGSPVAVIVFLIMGTVEVDQGHSAGFAMVAREIFLPFIMMTKLNVGNLIGDFFCLFTIYALAKMFDAVDVKKTLMESVLQGFHYFFTQAKDFRHMLLSISMIFLLTLLLGVGTFLAQTAMVHTGFPLLLMCTLMTVFKALGYIVFAMYICRTVYQLQRPNPQKKSPLKKQKVSVSFS